VDGNSIENPRVQAGMQAPRQTPARLVEPELSPDVGEKRAANLVALAKADEVK
jgi:hypothetical protein